MLIELGIGVNEREIITMTYSTDENIAVINSISEDQEKDLLALYKNEWWSCDRTENDVKVILKNSSLIFGLVDTNTNKLIGFTRVLTDFFKFVYIYDVIIDPKYRDMKLGKKLINTVLEHPAIHGINSVELICKKEMMSFYKQFGFTENYGESIAMRKLKKQGKL